MRRSGCVSLVFLGMAGLTPACSSAASDEETDADVAVSSDELTDSLSRVDTEIVGALGSDDVPHEALYATPKRYRAFSLSLIETTDVEISLTATRGALFAWVVDERFRVVAQTSQGSLSFRASRSVAYFLVFREQRHTTTRVSARCHPKAPGPVCRPKTCADVSSDACAADDGCGGSLSCTACPAGQTCGGGGVPGVCGAAAPMTCVRDYLGYAIPTAREGEGCHWFVASAGSHSAGVCHSGLCQPGCFIDGAYRSIGGQNPNNPCQVCDRDGGGGGLNAWTEVRSGWESSYPTCRACIDIRGNRTIADGRTCYSGLIGAGVCRAGVCARS